MEPLGVLRVEILGEIAMGLHWAGELLETGIVENPAPGSCCKKNEIISIAQTIYLSISTFLYKKELKVFRNVLFTLWHYWEKKDLIHTCRVVQDESSCLTKVCCGGNWKILVSTWVLAVEGGDKGPGEPEIGEAVTIMEVDGGLGWWLKCGLLEWWTLTNVGSIEISGSKCILFDPGLVLEWSRLWLELGNKNSPGINKF